MERYYKTKVPKNGDIISVKIINITDNHGADAKSAEYPDLNIFILPTEISKRRVNLNNFFDPNKLYPTKVLFVDADKKIVDVSYSKLNQAEREDALKRFNVYKKLYKIALDIHKKYVEYIGGDGDLEFILGNTVWKIFDNINNETTEQVDIFYTSVLIDPSLFFRYSGDEIEKKFLEEYVSQFKKRVNISDVILNCMVKINVLENGGINILKKILTTDIDPKVEIKCESAPRYKITASSREKDKCEILINQTVTKLKENCLKFNGRFVGEDPIHVVKDKTYNINL